MKVLIQQMSTQYSFCVPTWCGDGVVGWRCGKAEVTHTHRHTELVHAHWAEVHVVHAEKER